MLGDAGMKRPSPAIVTRRHWKADADAPNCDNGSCGARFQLTRRRHHCRRCGGVFCAPCSSDTVLVDADAAFVVGPSPAQSRTFRVRACGRCADQYRQCEQLRLGGASKRDSPTLSAISTASALSSGPWAAVGSSSPTEVPVPPSFAPGYWEGATSPRLAGPYSKSVISLPGISEQSLADGAFGRDSDAEVVVTVESPLVGAQQAVGSLLGVLSAPSNGHWSTF